MLGILEKLLIHLSNMSIYTGPIQITLLFQSLDGLTEDLTRQLKTAHKEADVARDGQRRRKDQLRQVQQEMNTRISDMHGLSDKFSDLLNT